MTEQEQEQQEQKELELFNTWWYSIEYYMDEREAAEEAWLARAKLIENESTSTPNSKD